MRDEHVNHDRRKVLAASAAVLATPLLGAGMAHGKGTESEPTGLRPGDPTEKNPAEIAAYEARVRLGRGAAGGPVALFAPVGLGEDVGFGWVLSEVKAPERGAMLVVLTRQGEEARVHVCRNAGCAAGVASTETLDFLIMNRGAGGEATDEDLGRAVTALAGLAARSGVQVDGLMTHEERIARWIGDEPGALQ